MAVLCQLVTNSNTKISDAIALNPSFMMFPSKINVRLDFKRLFICLYLKSLAARKPRIKCLSPLLFTGSSKNLKRVDGRFVMKNNKIYTKNGISKLQNHTEF